MMYYNRQWAYPKVSHERDNQKIILKTFYYADVCVSFVIFWTRWPKYHLKDFLLCGCLCLLCDISTSRLLPALHLMPHLQGLNSSFVLQLLRWGMVFLLVPGTRWRLPIFLLFQQLFLAEPLFLEAIRPPVIKQTDIILQYLVEV